MASASVALVSALLGPCKRLVQPLSAALSATDWYHMPCFSEHLAVGLEQLEGPSWSRAGTTAVTMAAAAVAAMTRVGGEDGADFQQQNRVMAFIIDPFVGYNKGPLPVGEARTRGSLRGIGIPSTYFQYTLVFTRASPRQRASYE